MADQLSNDLASLRIARDSNPRRGAGLRLGLTVLVVLIAAGAAYAFGAPYLESKLFKTEVAFTAISVVSPAQAQVELTSTGYVVPETVSHVAAKVPGKVGRVLIKRGDQVKAGDLLFELEQLDQKAMIASARSRAAAARARAETAKASAAEARLLAQRQRALAKEGVAPTGNADDAEARVASLEAQVKAAQAEAVAAEAEVGTLKVNLDSYQIFAPISGTVLNKPPEVGEFVGPQPAGISVDMGGVELADFASLVVEADVPEQRLHLVKLGGPCEIVLDAYPARRYRGKAKEIEPKVNRAKATVSVKVAFVDKADGALPEMAARVSFLSSELDAEAAKQPPKTIVPAAAIADRAGGKVVFAVEGDVVRITPVKLGPAFGGGFELVSGPRPGTRLVKNPPPELEDGQKVKEAVNDD